MITKKFKFSNGDKVEEIITGFVGTITGTAYYLTGCSQYCVVPKLVNNEHREGVWYDEGRLRLIEKSQFVPDDIESDEDGCDTAPPMGRRGM